MATQYWSGHVCDMDRSPGRRMDRMPQVHAPGSLLRPRCQDIAHERPRRGGTSAASPGLRHSHARWARGRIRPACGHLTARRCLAATAGVDGPGNETGRHTPSSVSGWMSTGWPS
jgi:hypothetical protein